MPDNAKLRPAQRPPAGKPASPLIEGESRGVAAPAAKRSSLLDTRIIYCGDCLDQLRKLPDACVDLIYIDPPFNSNRNYELFWGETKEKRAFKPFLPFNPLNSSTPDPFPTPYQAYIDYMRPWPSPLARRRNTSGKQPPNEPDSTRTAYAPPPLLEKWHV